MHAPVRHLLTLWAVTAAVTAATTVAVTVVAPIGAAARAPGTSAGRQQLVNQQPSINAADSTAQDTQAGTSIAADNGVVVVPWLDSAAIASQHFSGYARSTNNGLTFSDRGAVPDSSAGDDGPTQVAFDTQTHALYLVTSGIAVPDFLPVFRSTDGGATFGAAVDAAPLLGSGNAEERPSIVVDNAAGAGQHNVYLCWTHTNGSVQNIDFGRSTDGGASFTPGAGLQISPGGEGCSVAVAPNHDVYVAYYRGTGTRGEGGDNKLFLRRSTDAGVSFGPEMTVADLQTTTADGQLDLVGGKASTSYPALAVNPVNGNLYVAYNDDAAGADAADVYYVRSANSGATWTAPAQVNNDDNDLEQYQPSIAVSTTGASVMFGYYSTVNDPTQAAFHRRGRIGTVAANGAVTLQPSFQLGPDTPTVASQDPLAARAVRDGLTSTPGYFHSAWSDNRTGNAFHTYQSDIRYARVNDTPVTVQPKVTLALPASGVEGQNVNLRATVTNAGANRAEDVFVHLALPAGLAPQSAVGNGGTTCHRYGGLIGCYIGGLASGGTRTIDVTTLLTGSGTSTARATVTTSSKDTKVGDNTQSKSISISATTGTTTTSSSGSIATAIQDESSVLIPIDVPTDGGTLSVQAAVRLDHTFDNDLAIYLVSPSGSSVELSTRNGGSGDNFGTGANNCTGTKTVFSDGAGTSIIGSAAPFAGTFRPEQPLQTFAGENTQGQWLLRVDDTATTDVGVVGCVDLTIRSN